MRLIRGLHNLRASDRGCVATIGNFDGIHLGHRAVFQRLLERGRALDLPATVITFEPQPMEFFAPERAPARLTRLREKLSVIADCGIERVMLLEFNDKLASLTPQAFIHQLLIDGLSTRFLLVGDDFRFGHQRSGDFNMLQTAGQLNGFAVEDLHTIKQNDERVSSTRIREALALGDLAQARHLLGRPYSLCGRVGHGDKRGRSIGFPTANLALHRRNSPVSGVFAVRVHGIGEQPWPAVANVGHRPTVGGEDHRLEVHLFDFDGDLYGRQLEVEFCLKLREEQRFDSFEALKTQIERDALAARDFLGVP